MLHTIFLMCRIESSSRIWYVLWN